MFYLNKLRHYILPVLLLGSLAVVVAGITHYASTWPMYWGTPAIADFSAWIASCLLASLFLKRRTGPHAAPLLIIGILIYLIAGVGLANAASVVFFLFSTFMTGRVILGLLFRNESKQLLLDQSLMVGLAVQLAVFGILIHYPINSQALYFLVLTVPTLMLMRTGLYLAYGRHFARQIRTSSECLARLPYWNLVVSVILLGQVARFAMFPTVGYDDNAQHLRMWTELVNNGRYGFDVVSQIGAVVPFAVDLLHSIVSLLAGSDARSALNLAFLVLLFRQVWLLAKHLVAGDTDRLLLLVLFASTPILAHLLTSLQTELFLALLATAGVRLAIEKRGMVCGNNTVAIVAVAAMCCATKLPGAVLGLTLLLAYFARLASCRISLSLQRNSSVLGGLLIFIPVVVFVAFHSYFAAWRITGNPVFPFYNAIFNSPFYPASNFSDLRYIKGFSFSSYWDVFFKTAQYYESLDFVAGFQYLLLLPIGVMLLFRRLPRWEVWSLAVPLFGYGLIMFSTTQYWRYLFPVLPLAGLVIGSIITAARLKGNKWSLLVVRGVLVAYTLINFYFLPGISWYFSVPPQQVYSEVGRHSVTEQLAPAKTITNYLNQHSPGMTVLYDYDSPYGATLAGKPIYVNWYSPKRNERVMRWQREDDVASFLRDENIHYVAWNLASSEKRQEKRELMSRHLSVFGFPEYQAGSWILYRLFDHEIHYRTVFSLKNPFHPDAEGSSLAGAFQKPIVADQRPRIIASVKTDGANIARYNATFQCNSPSGHFIAQINWDIAPVYYRLIPCEANKVIFSEAIPIPAGAKTGEVYLTVRGATQAIIDKLEIETN